MVTVVMKILPLERGKRVQRPKKKRFGEKRPKKSLLHSLYPTAYTVPNQIHAKFAIR